MRKPHELFCQTCPLVDSVILAKKCRQRLDIKGFSNLLFMGFKVTLQYFSNTFAQFGSNPYCLSMHLETSNFACTSSDRLKLLFEDQKQSPCFYCSFTIFLRFLFCLGYKFYKTQRLPKIKFSGKKLKRAFENNQRPTQQRQNPPGGLFLKWKAEEVGTMTE